MRLTFTFTYSMNQQTCLDVNILCLSSEYTQTHRRVCFNASVCVCACVFSLFITLSRRIKEEKTFCVASDSNST